MPLDPAIRKELDIWLHKSREDLRAAELDLHAQPPLLSDALAMDSFPELDPHLDNIAHLTSYAVESRYPSDAPDPQLDEATANLELAKNFVSEITTLLAIVDKQH
jgi:hypothetical protein